MTVASLQDLGYVVDLNAAEPYSLPNLLVLAEEGLLAAPLERAARGIVLRTFPSSCPRAAWNEVRRLLVHEPRANAQWPTGRNLGNHRR